jgi:hypothetical protein
LGAFVAQQQRSGYLDRLGRSSRLDSWGPDDLVAALAVIDDLDAAREKPGWNPHTLDLRLAIYRRRLQYELDRRAAPADHAPGSLDRR